MLMAASMCFPLGLTLPLVRFERLWLFEDTPSLFGLVGGLWGEGELALAGLVALVSVAFPAAKLAVAHWIVVGAHAPPRWLAHLSKWSMTDVLLVAIAIVAAKSSGLASATTLPGVWFYLASAVLAFAATARLETRIKGETGPAGLDRGPRS